MEVVREPAVAGSFYPESPVVLEELVDSLLAAPSRPLAADCCPKALIVPHAAFEYSGAVAASAFALVAPYADRIERVVVIGPAHKMYVDGLVSPGATILRTPLHDFEVEVPANIPESPRAHAREHSIEVELPFLARVAPRARIVPLIGSDAEPHRVADVLESLWGGPETLIVISSDLSHYLPYAEARARDERTVVRILALEPGLSDEDACGALGINGLAWVARKKELVIELVDRKSSGDTAGTHDAVVGYAAFALFEDV
jgi:AmmeMemoRadiSam system protein B